MAHDVQNKLGPVTNLTYIFCLLPVPRIMTIRVGSVKPQLKIGLLSKTLQDTHVANGNSPKKATNL